MPRSSEEVLQDLVNATLEAKNTIRELHEARSAAMDVIKKQRGQIVEAIAAEVKAQVSEVINEAHELVLSSAGEMIDRIEKDWREKLGLQS